MTLEPLREALLADVRAEAERLLAAADRAAAAAISAAEEECARLVEQARVEGEAAAELAGAHAAAQARRRGRAAVLSAQRELYETLRTQARDRARELRGTPEQRSLLARLRTAVRTQLGEHAIIEAEPDGGLRARLDGRTVDYTIDALVGRALAQLGGRVQGLWA